MTATFDDRMNVALDHEKAVIARLREYGWTCDHFGQGLLMKPVRDALRAVAPKTSLRYLPDVLAIREGRLILVDAKAEQRQDTDNHALEIDSVIAHLGMIPVFGCEILYVFSDFRVASPASVLRDSFRPRSTVRTQAKGSGTPYVLLPKSETFDFGPMFGERQSA